MNFVLRLPKAFPNALKREREREREREWGTAGNSPDGTRTFSLKFTKEKRAKAPRETDQKAKAMNSDNVQHGAFSADWCHGALMRLGSVTGTLWASGLTLL